MTARRRLLLVTGSRTWTDRARVAQEIAALSPATHDLMHGACQLRDVDGLPGSADMLADEVALEGCVARSRPCRTRMRV
jgi:hypothetical protein